MQNPIVSRIKRIEGQVAGVGRMYQAGRDCVEVVQQVQAARVALGGLATALLSDEAERCIKKGDTKELERIVKKTFKTV